MIFVLLTSVSIDLKFNKSAFNLLGEEYIHIVQKSSHLIIAISAHEERERTVVQSQRFPLK